MRDNVRTCPALTGRTTTLVILTAPPGSADCGEDSGQLTDVVHTEVPEGKSGTEAA